MFGGARPDRRSNDRVLWVVATEALHKSRGIDGRDIHVHVEDAVVTLEGTVRSRDEKRRAEALVDQRGVRDVRNHLHIRERRFF
jgi:osmotically-inducible protein OsmY